MINIKGTAGESIILRLIKNGFSSFFIGRETATKRETDLLGVKTKGRLKSEEEIKQDQTNIISFLDYLKSLKRQIRYKDNIMTAHFEIIISYLLHPFADKEEMIKLIDEMEYFESLSDGFVHVLPQFSVLRPYPGTEIRKNHIGQIHNPANEPYQFNQLNPWQLEIGYASQLIGPIIMHNLQYDKEGYFRIYGKHLRSLINRGFTNRLTDDEKELNHLSF